MSLGEFDELQRLAERPFYTTPDGFIVLPANHVASMMVNACMEARAASRPCPPDQLRARVDVSDFLTAKTESDGVWERFAVVTGGTGAKLSNQRALRRNEYIEDFDARGTFALDPDFVRPDTLQKLLEWAGENVGIGASRKMGWGRFTVSEFKA